VCVCLVSWSGPGDLGSLSPVLSQVIHLPGVPALPGFWHDLGKDSRVLTGTSITPAAGHTILCHRMPL